MSQSLSNFIGGFNGGLRTNRFIVNSPKISGDQPFHIRAASLPAVNTTVLQIPHRGRVFKMPGQRTYEPWTITVLDDTANKNFWRTFYDWANTIQNHVSNQSNASNFDFTDQMTTFTVKQLDFNGNNMTKQVVLNRVWPSNIGEIRFSADEAESLSSFTVQLEYQYIESYT